MCSNIQYLKENRDIHFHFNKPWRPSKLGFHSERPQIWGLFGENSTWPFAANLNCFAQTCDLHHQHFGENIISTCSCCHSEKKKKFEDNNFLLCVCKMCTNSQYFLVVYFQVSTTKRPHRWYNRTKCDLCKTDLSVVSHTTNCTPLFYFLHELP